MFLCTVSVQYTSVAVVGVAGSAFSIVTIIITGAFQVAQW